MSAKQKRKRFDLELKYKIVTLIDNNQSIDEIVKKFSDYGLTSRNVYKIKSQRVKIVEAFISSKPSNVKSLRKCNYPELEQALVEFVANSSTNGLPVNTGLLMEKANQLAPTFGYYNFNANNGFIDRFKKRNEVVFEVSHGEASGVSDILCNDWISNKLPQILEGFKCEDIYNGDELGLFWRITPSKSYVIKGQTFKNGKKSKERVSVFVCSNSTGTHKLKMIVIGKSKEPRSFRGNKSMPVIYRNNTKSWMTSEIFIEFLHKFNKQMILSDRKVALILDNCSAHPSIKLSNVKLIYLPPNATSRLQPMDAGVIHCLKSNYRKKLVRRLLALYEDNNSFDVKNITLYEAILMLSNSWDDINSQIITNCFKKCGIGESESINETTVSSDEQDFDNQWQQLCDNITEREIDFNEYISFDDNVVTNINANQLTDTLNDSSQGVCDVTEDMNQDSDEN
ncbi:tigger transposable element-derived protein 4-like [Oppia nitens]|uniref:tigger transposable element-derived protein 4-like n=1 Tax=Oppia nitens TaxID=1686743 RepID=UPI0023DA6F7E|nr:tigger transposable element-derived protein 4-like [Oppia nitens]